MNRNDDNFDHDELIDQLYRDESGELPPTKLDNLILAKARGQTAPATPRRKPRWAIPLVAVAMPALALGVVLKLGNFNFGDGSYEPSSSGVYSTNDFVLHIPEKDAASQIKRVPKPDFSQTNALARNGSTANELAEIASDNMTAEINTEVVEYQKAEAQAISRQQQAVLSSTGTTSSNSPAIVITEQQSIQFSQPPMIASAEPEMSQEAMRELPLAKTEALQAPTDTYARAAAPSPAAEAQLEEIAVTGARRSREYDSDDTASADSVNADESEFSAARASAPASAPTPTAAAAPMPAPASGGAATELKTLPDTPLQQCAEIRPEVCTKIYRPVCAQRDSGTRCVMAPCPQASEWVTYGNDCSACADERVMGYHQRSCDSLILPE